MRKFLLASHGRLAEGIYSSIQIILGCNVNISTICAYTDENISFEQQVENAINNMSLGDELIVVTDIYGGSVNNEFMKYIERDNVHLVAGMNLPLLIELLTRQEHNTEMLIEGALRASKKSIMYCNKILTTACSPEDDEF